MTKRLDVEAGDNGDVLDSGKDVLHDAGDELDDDRDDEAVLPTKPANSNENNETRYCSALIDYDIIHSPTYQVPVLYLTCRHPPPLSSSTTTSKTFPLESIFNLVVPQSHRAGLLAVGEVGALSATDHPVTNLPCLFIHPCRTSEAMGEILAERDVSPEEYLMTWLGLVGKSAGLSVPLALAESLSTQSQDGGRSNDLVGSQKILCTTARF